MEPIILPKLDPVPPLILPGSVEYERKHNPFRPSSRNAPIPLTSPTIKPTSSTGKRNTKNVRIKSPKDDDKQSKQMDSLDILENVICAQSHEPLKLTTSIWHPREGRLNIDKASILTMGSGSNDIRNLGEFETLEDTQQYQSRLYISESMTKNEHKSHDLTASFIKTGPYNSINHKFWSAEINDIDDIPDEELDDSLENLIDQFDMNETFLSKKLQKEQRMRDVEERNRLILEGAKTNNNNNNNKDGAIVKEESKDKFDSHLSLNGNGNGSRDVIDDLTRHTLTHPTPVKAITPTHNQTQTQTNERKIGTPPNKRKDVSHSRGGGRGNSRNSNKLGAKMKDKKSNDTSSKAKNSMIGNSIDTTNAVNWAAVEKKEYEFLKQTVLQMEKDKVVTHEKPFKGRDNKIGVEAAEVECKDLAKLKVRMLRGELLAIQDEEVREEKRKKDEDDNKKNKTKLKQLKETHESERHKFRTYLRTMKHDNEIVIAKRMNDNGFLW